MNTYDYQVRTGVRCPACKRNLAWHWRDPLAKCINPQCSRVGQWIPAPERHAA